MKSESTHIFLSYDGAKLEGTLRVPGGRCERIALLVHGITSSRDELGLFSGLAKHLAERGVASFRFDYRCHGVNSQPMQTMTLAGIVNDIEAGFLCANELMQPASVHPIGMSFGGGLTAYWAATTDANVESVVLLAPVIDYQQDVLGQHGLLDGERVANLASRSLLNSGYVETDGIQYGAALVNELPHINGIAGLKRLKCRSLILHGDADSVVPYSSSAKFAALNTRCNLVNVPGTDHGFGVPGDEDLTSPETKARHAEVFGIIAQFLLSEV
jgi:pimeloyl-ACP methyl ester carboxylesterase